jgi:hypothetical protein
MALLYSLLVSGTAAGAAALLADCPAWLLAAALFEFCGFVFVCFVSEVVSWFAHVPRLEQAMASLGFLPAVTDIPAKRRPEHARKEVKNVFRGNWNGHHVQLFEFEFVWSTTEYNHRETPLCAGLRVPGNFSAVTVEPRERFRHPAAPSREPFDRRYFMAGAGAKLDSAHELRQWFGEHPGEWHFRLDGQWLFCWRVPRVDTEAGITELLTTIAGIADRLPDESDHRSGRR